ncbi:MAG: GbsR/MarR family transcriptional regulator [Haloarculaceae archaeon]
MERDDAERAREGRETVIEALARSAEVYGAKRSYGRLYGILFFADEPLSLDTLVAKSDYAKSTVSTAMSTLERLHLVHRRSMPGEGKKAFFEAERDIWHVFQEFLRHEVTREIDIMTRALADAAEDLEAAGAEDDLEKVQSLKREYERSERFVNLLTSRRFEQLSGILDRLRRE